MPEPINNQQNTKKIETATIPVKKIEGEDILEDIFEHEDSKEQIKQPEVQKPIIEVNEEIASEKKFG